MSNRKAGELDLDPGVRRRTAPSGIRCCFWTTTVFGALVIGWILFLLGSGLYQAVGNVRFPHRDLYHKVHNDSLGPIHESVVRPLIDRGQAFDIAVSVWLRATDAEEAAHQRKVQEEENVGGQTTGQETTSLSNIELDILWTPLYSEVVFRGLHLTDKNIQKEVLFRMPTTRFYSSNLSSADLRGSFALIPSSPSLLDHLTNFSTWIPSTINPWPIRSWPFPLGGPANDDGPSLADQAIDAFGTNLRLIEFIETPSLCTNATDFLNATVNASASGSSEPSGNVDKVEDEEDWPKEEKNKPLPSAKSRRHPYIATRTQLRLIDETELLDRKKYNKKHNQLKATSCGQDFPQLKPSLSRCKTSYQTHGHWGTRLQLAIPVHDDEARTEWAYAPYLLAGSGHAAGTLDLIPVPVTRENCSAAANSTSDAVTHPSPGDAEFLDITWHISFSGRSLGKIAAADLVRPTFRAAHNASDYAKVKSQDRAELVNGVFGHRFRPDAHPRRRVAIQIITVILVPVLGLLDMYYWYTRASTVGISIPAALLSASAITLDFAVTILHQSTKHGGGDGGQNASLQWAAGFWWLVVTSFLLLPTFAQIKAALRIELTRWKGFPVPVRARPTHKERASERLDAKTGWLTPTALFFAFIALYHFFEPAQRHLIPSLLPTPTPSDEERHDSMFLYAVNLIGVAGPLTSVILQCILNHRARTFAGMYKSAALLNLVSGALHLAELAPPIVGVYPRHGYTLDQALQTVGAAVMAYQAMTLPSVAETGDDKDEE